jgi:hypothetical protein
MRGRWAAAASGNSNVWHLTILEQPAPGRIAGKVSWASSNCDLRNEEFTGTLQEGVLTLTFGYGACDLGVVLQQAASGKRYEGYYTLTGMRRGTAYLQP